MIFSSNNYYPDTYHQSRQRFYSWLEIIREIWPAARLESRKLPDHEDLTVDWIRADCLSIKEHMILLTAGIHGVEGYVGSAIQKVFIEEYLTGFDPQTTGITLVHSINPWGMLNKRRVNPNNVDLNRNFLVDQKNFLQEFNSSYIALNTFLNPSRPIQTVFQETFAFLMNVIKSLTRSRIPAMRGAIMLGQRSYPEGLYYCGSGYQAETQVLIELIKELFQHYRSIYQIDLHTGYGPRYQMSLINSPNESRTSEELEEFFNYPRVLRADPDQFYQMQGDMINWAYQLQRDEYPDIAYYGTAFEFGTYGSGILAEIASLKDTLFENQAHFHGTGSDLVVDKIRGKFLDLYCPSEDRWRSKVLDDARQAFRGIFKAYRLI